MVSLRDAFHTFRSDPFDVSDIFRRATCISAPYTGSSVLFGVLSLLVANYVIYRMVNFKV